MSYTHLIEFCEQLEEKQINHCEGDVTYHLHTIKEVIEY